jgi:hypothetical protein
VDEGRMEEGSRCTAASFEIPDVCLDRVIKQRLAILGKLAKLDAEEKTRNGI